MSKDDLARSKGFKACRFSEHGVVNPCKRRFVKNASSIKADLYFCDGEPDVEYIVYTKTSGAGNLSFDSDNNTFSTTFYNRDAAANFLSILGFSISCRDMTIEGEIKGIFDKKHFTLFSQGGEKYIEPFLDNTGWNCPCFLVDSVKKAFQKFAAGGVICSKVDDLTIHGRSLEVGFVKSEAINVIFEFISPKN